MKTWLYLICLAMMWGGIFAAITWAQKEPPTIEWKGWPVFAGPYNGIDPGFYGSNLPPSMTTEPTIQLGLRSDGVVVWRKVEKP